MLALDFVVALVLVGRRVAALDAGLREILADRLREQRRVGVVPIIAHLGLALRSDVPAMRVERRDRGLVARVRHINRIEELVLVLDEIEGVLVAGDRGRELLPIERPRLELEVRARLLSF